MTNRLFIIWGLLVVAAGCTTTITRGKPPVFGESTDSLAARLHLLVMAQHYQIDGSEATTNGKKQTEVQVDVINGENIPEDDSWQVLAKSVALAVKKALKDTGEYEQYKIRFVKEKEAGGLTTRSWTAKVFPSAELQWAK